MNNQLKSILLLGGLTALVAGLGATLAPGYSWIFLALALAMNLGGWFFSDRMILAMSGAREVSREEAQRLHAIVEELAERAGLPKPRVMVVEDEQPNAFATGRTPEKGVVAVTTGILALLDTRELRGVIAHELAHIKNRDVLVGSIAAAAASCVTWIANLAGFGLLGGQRDGEEREGAGAGGLLLMLVAPLAASLVQLGISRQREYLADEWGARLCGDPEALASALEKLQGAAEVVPSERPSPATASLFIVNPLAGASSLFQLFSTHPPVEERARRLRALARGAEPARSWSPRGARWLEG